MYSDQWGFPETDIQFFRGQRRSADFVFNSFWKKVIKQKQTKVKPINFLTWHRPAVLPFRWEMSRGSRTPGPPGSSSFGRLDRLVRLKRQGSIFELKKVTCNDFKSEFYDSKLCSLGRTSLTSSSLRAAKYYRERGFWVQVGYPIFCLLLSRKAATTQYREIP